MVGVWVVMVGSRGMWSDSVHVEVSMGPGQRFSCCSPPHGHLLDRCMVDPIQFGCSILEGIHHLLDHLVKEHGCQLRVQEGLELE